MKTAYHHGDLRSALIDVGLRLLAERAADDLGLREVARQVGVSATAVYRHFPDKRALLSAARPGWVGASRRRAARGFRGGGRRHRRIQRDGPGLRALRARQPCPVPAHLLVASPGGPPRGGRRDDARRLRVSQGQRGGPRAAGADAGAVQAIALQAWSLAHGLAMLMIDGQVPVDDALIDAVVPADDLMHGADRRHETRPRRR